MKKIKVNHGDVWGRGSDWITYYCGECSKQMLVDQKRCEHCGAKEVDDIEGR